MKNVLLGILVLTSITAFAESNFSKCSKDNQDIQLVHKTDSKTDILGRIDGIYIGISSDRTSTDTGEFFISKIATTTVILKIDNEYGKAVLQIFSQDGLIEKNLICN